MLILDYDSNGFLQPTVEILDIFGAKNVEAMRYSGEIWRFFTPVLLHKNLIELLANILLSCMFGSRLEPMIGNGRMAVLYVFSTFGGILLSCLTSSASVATGKLVVMGILGGTLGWFYLNWRAMANPRSAMIQVIFTSVFIFFFIIFGGADFGSLFGATITGGLTGLTTF